MHVVLVGPEFEENLSLRYLAAALQQRRDLRDRLRAPPELIRDSRFFPQTELGRIRRVRGPRCRRAAGLIFRDGQVRE